MVLAPAIARKIGDAQNLGIAAPGLCLLLALGGCGSIALQDSPTASINVPEAWSAAHVVATGGNTSLALWWRHFDDPLLGSLVEQALLANTSVRSAQVALRQSRALRDVAAAGLLPILGSSASAQQSRTDGNNTGDRFKAWIQPVDATHLEPV